VRARVRMRETVVGGEAVVEVERAVR
jgi:hypothetical protein